VLEEGSVLMQVSGRPVFVLRGSVPMYRGLGPGSSGDDVRQLQLALGRLGFGTGGVTGNYRQGTASAVSRWYVSKGYQALEPGVGEQQELGQLESAVSDAQLALLAAQSPGGGGAKGEAAAPPDSAAARELVLHSAQRRLQLADSALGAYRSGYGTKIAAGEVLFLPKLPVRLDKVKVRLGDTPDAQVATVTSSDIVVQAVVPGTDARLLHKGMAVQVRTADGRKAQGTIARIGGSPAGSDSASDSKGSGSDPSAPVPLDVSIADPGPLADSTGGSVTLTVEVGGSDGRVLTVPVAAVHTSVDGKARVRVQRGGRVVDVHVGLGISASGLVEVKPEGGTLEEGNRVVVGP
jgi:peptidoglycan hydrolase-like protein with peptidoglycan-binding domain